MHFKDRAFNSSITVLPKILAKIPLLIFAGDQDFICNYVGLESMIQAMSWNGGNGLGVRSFYFPLQWRS
jgi:carboxypeptidase D